jgi:hypothetical protein
MDATQRLCEPSDDENETTFNLEEFEKKVFGKFVFVKQGGDDNADPEISFDVFGGENRIGRDSEQSRIVLDNKVRWIYLKYLCIVMDIGVELRLCLGLL